jgi:phosphate transport system permease protein
MALTPDSTAVGSSEKTSPQQVGHTSEKPTKDRKGSALRQGEGHWGDTVFKSVAIAAGATIIGAIALMALFLIVKAIPSLQANQANFLTSTEFLTSDSANLRFGIRDLFMVTVLSSVFALIIAVPIAILIGAVVRSDGP